MEEKENDRLTKKQVKAVKKLEFFLESKTSYGLGYALRRVERVEIPSEIILEILGFDC